MLGVMKTWRLPLNSHLDRVSRWYSLQDDVERAPTYLYTLCVRFVLQRRSGLCCASSSMFMHVSSNHPVANCDARYLSSFRNRSCIEEKSFHFFLHQYLFGSVVRLLLGGLSISITTAKTLLFDVPENGKKIIPLLVESAHLFMCLWVVLRLRKQSPAVARNMPWGCVSEAVPALNF